MMKSAIFWELLRFIEPLIETSKEVLSSRPKLKAFMEHIVVRSTITHFVTKNVELVNAVYVYVPVCMDQKFFPTLRYLPDPILGSDGHYLVIDTFLPTLSTHTKGSSKGQF